MAEDVTNEQEAGEGQSLGVESLWRAVENVVDAQVEDPLLGRTIGGVTLVRLLGEGGMGRVYEGMQESPRRPVALKVLWPGFSPPRFYCDFSMKARSSASFGTPTFPRSTRQDHSKSPARRCRIL